MRVPGTYSNNYIRHAKSSGWRGFFGAWLSASFYF